jgi:hypothetical protein
MKAIILSALVLLPLTSFADDFSFGAPKVLDQGWYPELATAVRTMKVSLVSQKQISTSEQTIVIRVQLLDAHSNVVYDREMPATSVFKPGSYTYDIYKDSGGRTTEISSRNDGNDSQDYLRPTNNELVLERVHCQQSWKTKAANLIYPGGNLIDCREMKIEFNGADEIDALVRPTWSDSLDKTFVAAHNCLGEFRYCRQITDQSKCTESGCDWHVGSKTSGAGDTDLASPRSSQASPAVAR